MVAISLSALAAFWASDTSLAGESVNAIAGTAPATLTSAAPGAPRLNSDSSVAFAPSREIVQPFGQADAPLVPDEQIDRLRSLDAMVMTAPVEDTLDEETRCLAGAVYFEAKSESLTGQLAVARVVINRARSGRFADSLCGVVYQPGQFSFVRGRSMPAINTGSRDWREAVAIARIALENSWSENPAEGALFFHARRVSPSWNRQKIAAIDNHIFYR